MLNRDRYKTAQERAEAFKKWFAPYANPIGMSNYPIISAIFNWLDLEAEEEKQETVEDVVRDMLEWPSMIDSEEAKYLAKRILAAHNRVAKKCREVKE